MSHRPATSKGTLAVRTPRRPKVDVGAQGQLPRRTAVLLLVDFINPLDFPG